MEWHAAVEAAGDGVRLRLLVRPASTRDRFPDGYDPWRGRLCVAVTAPAQAGLANQAVLRLVAGALEVPGAAVTLQHGASDGRKSVQVAGITRSQALEALGAHL